jgi:hypothetical protein
VAGAKPDGRAPVFPIAFRATLRFDPGTHLRAPIRHFMPVDSKLLGRRLTTFELGTVVNPFLGQNDGRWKLFDFA